MHRGSSHRFLFYSKELDRPSKSVELNGDEHHHASKVLRLNTGDIVFVTNGRGLISRCEVEDIGRATTRLGVRGLEVDARVNRPLTLALGCLKKDAFEQAVRQCTELGVDCCVPFASQKSHLKEYTGVFLERLRRVALASMKQSFRATLPVIEGAIQFDELIARARRAELVIVGDSDGDPLTEDPAQRSLMIIVGPEGGFTEREKTDLSSIGSIYASVSSNRLRSETAAASLAAVVQGLRRGRATGATDSIDSP
ncbi:MAG: 16S rRNA (uracil(1498)-N(3))-methyltransferase [Candidatus Latescibacterota bacterium]|nr:MAG: 16S rRNA (uracil(1498)-N(3))-methyltransferase [Candidatus Latescibacterota bacterium]